MVCCMRYRDDSTPMGLLAVMVSLIPGDYAIRARLRGDDL